MPDALYFVQFPHPGGEPRASHDGWVPWNSSKTHARKCLRIRGRWRASPNLDALEHDGEVVFWGEWEPPSRLQATENAEDRGMPRYIHAPFWHPVPDQGYFHNTDPYVFGDRFRYSNCRQNTKNGPRTTQRLARGSLLVFGSHDDGDFVLDTVFVVAQAEAICFENHRKLSGVDDVFRSVVLDILYRDRSPQFGYRMYAGASPDAPEGGMFSFFPCLPASEAPKGFPRPAIRLGKDLINPQCTRNFKLARRNSLDEVGTLWHRVVRQVLDAGLYLGVHAATPKSVPGSYQVPRGPKVGGRCGPGEPTKSPSACGKTPTC